MTPNPALHYLALPWSWSIKFDAESNCWLATIRELPDFFAAGKTAGEAAGNAREALLSHLQGYLNGGIEVPMPVNRGQSRGTSGVEETRELVTAAT